jgi:hypothetical protein
MQKKPLKPLVKKETNQNSLKNQILAHKKLLVLFGVLICLIVAVYIISTPSQKVVINNSNTSQPTSTDPTKNFFDNGNISFYYPKNWNQSQERIQAPLIVTVYKDENNSMSVYSENINNRPFADYVVDWRENLNIASNITYEQVTQIDNCTAYDVQASKRNMNGTYITRDLIFTKNKKVYYIIFIFNKSVLDFKEEMDLIINSFKVK